MDAKGLAKSKRAHSLAHSKKPHPNQKPRPTAPGCGSRSHMVVSSRERNRLSGLPANWDRYEEEDEEDLDDKKGENVTGESSDDVALPKSKGADFKYLVAEARSQRQRNACPDDGFLSLDDVFLGDFNQKMLAVRGESILSWTGDDNFVVDNEAASSQEVSIFSLNLFALSEQLAKVDISERLFIEADLFDPEDLKRSSSQKADLREISEATTRISGTPSFQDFNEKNKVLDHTTDIVSPASTAGGSSKQIVTEQGLDLLGQHAFHSTSSQNRGSNQTRALESSPPDNVRCNINPKTYPSMFEAATAEAELDMLLNPFSEAKTPGLIGLEKNKFVKESSEVIFSGSGDAGSSIFYSADKELDLLAQVGVELAAGQHSKSIQSKAPDFSPTVGMSYNTKLRKPTFETATAEAELDALLNSFTETKLPGSSDLPFDRFLDTSKDASTSIAPKELPSSLREFTANLDDVLDDLLAESSETMNQNGLHEREKVNATGPCDLQSSRIQPVSSCKVFDDFDSWMDTI